MLFVPPTPPHSKISPEKDGDLKTQVEKLWREVNALKEMQALQTGKRLRVTDALFPKKNKKKW